MDVIQKLSINYMVKQIKFFPGGKRPPAWDHYALEAGLGLCSQKHRTAGSCECVRAGEKKRGSWDAAAE